MPAKKSASRSRASHPVTKRELRENNPVIVDSIASRMEWWKKAAIWVVSIVAGFAALSQVWNYFGARTLVWNSTLDSAITNVKTEVGTKIDDTKREVVRNQNDIKSEITGSIGELSKTLNTISRGQSTSAMESAEMAQKLAFTQLQSLQGQLATVRLALQKSQNDTMLQTRVLQLETFIKQNEKDMQDAKDKMTRLRNGQ